MGNLSIKLTIGDRIYPLSIEREEEANVRKAVKLIEENLKKYEENYSVRDKQDLLAMCALQFANQVVSEEEKVMIEDNGIVENIESLDNFVSNYLNNN